MPDDTQDQAAPATDPLSALGQEIGQGIKDGTISAEEQQRYHEVIESHIQDVTDTLTGLRDDVRADVQHAVDDVRGPIEDLKAAHPDGDVTHLEPRETATVAGPAVSGMLDAADQADHAAIDIMQERLDAWRDIVDVRADRGDESPQVVQAQRDEIDSLQAKLDQARDDHDDMMDWARQHHEETVNYVIETNDDSVVHPQETLDAGHYNLPVSEHEVPEEA